MATKLNLTQTELDSIVSAAVKAALAELAQNPVQEPAKTKARAPRQTKKANRMACKWSHIEGLEVVTLQRHTYDVALMDTSRVKTMIANEVKDARKQLPKGTALQKILVDGTWAYVKLPKEVTRECAMSLHRIKGWNYSRKEHAFYRDFKQA